MQHFRHLQNEKDFPVKKAAKTVYSMSGRPDSTATDYFGEDK
jgi:hypothetical protein